MTAWEDIYPRAHRQDQDTGDSLIDRYPPGPEDDPEDYETLLMSVDVDLLVPTDEIRDGHRVWQEAPHRYSICEYPPGDRDSVFIYGLLFKLADEGVVRPTNEIRNGRRTWRSLIYDPKKLN